MCTNKIDYFALAFELWCTWLCTIVQELKVLHRGVHANRRPNKIDQLNWYRLVMAGFDASDGQWRVSTLRNRLQWVEWRVSSLETRATQPVWQKLKGWKLPRSGDDLALLSSDPATFGLPLLKSTQIRPRSTLFLTHICLNPAIFGWI